MRRAANEGENRNDVNGLIGVWRAALVWLAPPRTWPGNMANSGPCGRSSRAGVGRKGCSPAPPEQGGRRSGSRQRRFLKPGHVCKWLKRGEIARLFADDCR
jgi:hypothetical protein